MNEKWIIPGKLVSGQGRNVDEIGHRRYEWGWSENWGQEIIEQEIWPRVNKGDLILDLASSEGRASMAFSMRGMRVLMVDQIGRLMEEGNEIRRKAGARRAETLVGDMRTISRESLGGGADVIIASDALVHLTKNEADRMIDKLLTLLDPRRGGLIYANVPAAESQVFQFPEFFGVRRIDEKTLEVECCCTGEPRMEPIPFFEQGELEARLALLGGNVIGVKRIERNNGGILHEAVVEFGPRKRQMAGI